VKINIWLSPLCLFGGYGIFIVLITWGIIYLSDEYGIVVSIIEWLTLFLIIYHFYIIL
jgi:hypothetical protein